MVHLPAMLSDLSIGPQLVSPAVASPFLFSPKEIIEKMSIQVLHFSLHQ